MANNACIAIGIDRYQFFQPLRYAQADARALLQFLVEEAGLSPSKCLLLTDTSPAIGDRLAYPSRENLRNCIEAFCKEVLQPGDALWFFFSGYGVGSAGQEDYLMPIDGNPEDLVNTGISMRDLFKCFKQGSDRDIAVLLDMNRSFSVDADATVGKNTLELAQSLGIAAILSCQSNQYSHEAVALGHGLFAAALLEALRYEPSMSLASLERFLRDRLPQLCEHHWQPIQNPLSVIPNARAKRLSMSSFTLGYAPLLETTVAAKVADSDRQGLNFRVALPETPNQTNNDTAKEVAPPVAPVSVAPAPAATGVETQDKPGALVRYSDAESALDTEETPWWLQLVYWGTGTTLVLALILGVALKLFNSLQTAQKEPAKASPTLSGSPAPSNPVRIQEANVPTTTSPKPLSEESLSKLLVANRATLEKAKNLIQSNQASKFSKAIREAQKIRPNDPLYEQAQQNIARWSLVILDLAQGRAQQGDFVAAIAAAQLVPKEQSVYAESQQAIARWQQLAKEQRTNRIILQAARGLIREGQASSYNQAITAASKVQPGQAGYADAQNSIAQWSQKIYQLAQSRASNGQFQVAIQTAALIPQNTPSYEAAQKAIGKWKAK